jgi:hypothetical protein
MGIEDKRDLTVSATTLPTILRTGSSNSFQPLPAFGSEADDDIEIKLKQNKTLSRPLFGSVIGSVEEIEQAEEVTPVQAAFFRLSVIEARSKRHTTTGI